MLSSPSCIARLESQRTDRRHYGESFKIHKSSTKRESEVLVATDHVGIDVYDVRTSQNLVSRSVPPGEVFCCAPISILRKASKEGNIERFTYWVTKSSQKTRIFCHHESGDTSQVLSQSIPTAADKDNIRHLRVASDSTSKPAATHLVLAIGLSGNVNCFEPKLEALRWSTRLPSFDSSDSENIVEDVSIFNESDASSSLFKSRADILSTLPPTNGNDHHTQFLAVLKGRTPFAPKLHFYVVNSQLQELASSPVDHVPENSSQKTEWRIIPKRGELHAVSLGDLGKVDIYDIKGVVPILMQSLNLPHFTSALSISSSTIAVATNSALQTVAVKWASIDEEWPLDPTNSSGSFTNHTKLITFIPSTKILVLMHNDTLLRVSTVPTLPIQAMSPKLRKTGTLAQAVGRGIGVTANANANSRTNLSTKGFGKRINLQKHSETSKKYHETFDPLLATQDITQYDKAVLEELTKLFEPRDNGSSGFPHLSKPAIVDYALQQMFRKKPHEHLSTGSGDGLEVKRLAPEVFRFFLTRGLLTSYQISKSLASIEQPSEKTSSRPLSIVGALVTHDPTLQALTYYLGSAPAIEPRELTAALMHSIKLALRAEQEIDQRAIGEGKKDEQNGLSVGESEELKRNSEMKYTEGVDPSAFDGDWQDPDEQERIAHNARSVLKSSLTRLSVCNEGDILEALRTGMAPLEVLALIDYIRIELAGGGWLAGNLDEGLESQNDISAQSSQASTLTKMFNCAVDSLGSAAWLLSGSDEHDTSRKAEKVDYMRAEVNAALDGVHDSAKLENLLQEVLLFSESSEKIHRGQLVEGAPTGGGSYSASISPTLVQDQNFMLPFGLKGANMIATTKRGSKGKEVALSNRHIAYLKSKQVPEYSFEQIEI